MLFSLTLPCALLPATSLFTLSSIDLYNGADSSANTLYHSSSCNLAQSGITTKVSTDFRQGQTQNILNGGGGAKQGQDV